MSTVDTKAKKIRSHLRFIEKTFHPMMADEAARFISNNEKILSAMTGTYNEKGACMVFTDSRVIIVYGLLGSVVELPYTSIDRVDTDSTSLSLNNGSQVTRLTNTAWNKPREVKKVVHERREAFARQARERRNAQPRQLNVQGVSNADELEKLARLHRAGSITDREFSVAKARLLGS